jgi:hypothetical protein
VENQGKIGEKLKTCVEILGNHWGKMAAKDKICKKFGVVLEVRGSDEAKPRHWGKVARSSRKGTCNTSA